MIPQIGGSVTAFNCGAMAKRLEQQTHENRSVDVVILVLVSLQLGINGIHLFRKVTVNNTKYNSKTAARSLI